MDLVVFLCLQCFLRRFIDVESSTGMPRLHCNAPPIFSCVSDAAGSVLLRDVVLVVREVVLKDL